MGSDREECWCRIFRFSWLGHQLALEGETPATWCRRAPECTGHFAAASSIVCLGLFRGDKRKKHKKKKSTRGPKAEEPSPAISPLSFFARHQIPIRGTPRAFPLSPLVFLLFLCANPNTPVFIVGVILVGLSYNRLLPSLWCPTPFRWRLRCPDRP